MPYFLTSQDMDSLFYFSESTLAKRFCDSVLTDLKLFLLHIISISFSIYI